MLLIYIICTIALPGPDNLYTFRSNHVILLLTKEMPLSTDERHSGLFGQATPSSLSQVATLSYTNYLVWSRDVFVFDLAQINK